MRRQPENDSHKGTLFTFLDVLICTMGLLILLLVAIARQVSLQHAAEAAAKTPKVPASQFESEVLQLRIAALRIEREKADAELLKHRSILQQIEVRYRELQDQLAELEAARANLLQLLAGENHSPHRAELARLQSRIVDLKGKLADARARGISQQPSFAIVPYEGPNGTRRRPIYIECRADKLVLQPEGIEFSEEDFAGTLGPGNPLAAGLRAGVDHVNRNRRTVEGDAGEAYPLLLIRPDGINAYYAARAALRSWGADFGYEFIDGDWQLDFGRPDSQLAKVELRAVEDARERQQHLAASDHASGNGYGGKPFRGKYRVGQNGGLVRMDEGEPERPSFRANPAGGGLVREGGSRSPRPAAKPAMASPGNSAKPAMASPGRAPGTSPQLSASQPPGNSLGGASPSKHADESGGTRVLGPKPAGSGSGNSAAGSPARPGAGGGTPGMGQPGQPSDTAMVTDRQQPQIMPQQMFGQKDKNSSSGGGDTESLAKTRGKDWGLPSTGRGSFPITRPIRIQCYDDKIVLLPDSPHAPGAKEIPLGPRTSESVDELVNAVWEHIDAWGIAGKGMYWRPILHAEATPGGFARLSDLKILLTGSGLAIHDKTTEASRPAAVRSR